MKNGFFSRHPAIPFAYFCGVILSSVAAMHPAFVLVNLACSLALAFRLDVRGAARTLRFALPAAALFTILNPLVNTRGRTVLFLLWRRPVTLEALAYGAVSAAMFMSVILWFFSFGRVMTSDRLQAIFGRVFPSFSLLFCMTLRLVPRLTRRVRAVISARKGIGLDPMKGSPRERLKNALSILSAMATWGFENGVDTADSMRSRGFGLPGRTSFFPFRLTRRDVAAIALEIILAAVSAALSVPGNMSASFYPSLGIAKPNLLGSISAAAYALFCLLPIIFELSEAFRWNFTRSKA